jgi:hypothetical protein
MRVPVITPAVVEINEYETLTTSFTLTESNPNLEPEIYNFKAFPLIVNINEYSTYTLQTLSDTTFSITMTLSDVFTRSIGYVSNRQKGSVNRFGSLPADYDAIYRYIPPSSQYTSYHFTLPVYYGMGAITNSTLPNTNLTIEYHVRLDQTVSTQAFINALSKGGFTKRASDAGYYP